MRKENKKQDNRKENVKPDNKVVNQNKEDKKGLSPFMATLIVQVLVVFLTELGFRVIFGSSILDWSILRIFTSSALIGCFFTLITCWMKPVIRKIILVVLDFLIILYAWLQLCFMDFLGAFISMGSAEQGTKITDYIGDFILSVNWKNYLLFIIFILLILYFIFEKKIITNTYNDKISLKNSINIWSTLLCILVCVLVFMLTLDLGFMQDKYQTVSNRNLFKNASNPALAIKNFGTTVYFLLDAKGTLMGLDNEDEYVPINNQEEVAKKVETDNSRHMDDTIWDKVIEEETDSNFKKLNQYFKNREITDKNDYTGIFEGKNLIVVMLESVSSVVFERQYSEYFPTLYKMYSEGITAINHYSPRNNCATGESELTMATSLYSIETTCTVNTYKNNVYPEALLSIFKNNDYYTSAYHDYTDQYYNRSSYEKNLGAMDFYNVKGLGMSYNPAYVEWPSDVTFVKKALPKFIEKDKYASFMISVTSHSPYMYSSEWGNKYVSLFKDLNIDTTTKRYLSKVKVVDLAMEEMLKELEEAGKLEDTVIVLFGDHYPYALSNNQFNSLSEKDVTVNQEIDRTPFIIYNSGVESKAITKYATQLDITPTLLNMFGFEYDPRLYFGHDLMSEYEDYAIFPDNSWYSQLGFYNASKGVFHPNGESERDSYDDYIIAMNAKVTEYRNMSALAIKKNYFKNLFKKLDAKKEELAKEQELKEEENNKEVTESEE